MYSSHNECKSVVAERLMQTMNGKIHKKMTANEINLIWLFQKVSRRMQ